MLRLLFLVSVLVSCIDRIAALDSNQRPDASRFYSIVLPTFSLFLFSFCFPPLPHIGVPSLPPPAHPSSVCFAPFLSRRAIGQRTNDSRLIYRFAPHPLHFIFLFLLARCFVVRPSVNRFMHVYVITCAEGGRVLASRHTCRPVVLRDTVIRSSPFPPFPIPLPVTFISIHALVPFPLPLSLHPTHSFIFHLHLLMHPLLPTSHSVYSNHKITLIPTPHLPLYTFFLLFVLAVPPFTLSAPCALY